MVSEPQKQPEGTETAEGSQTSAISDYSVLERIALLKVKSLTAARGELIFPCIPSLRDRYISQIDYLLRALGQNFSAEEMAALTKVITTRLEEGFRASPYSRLVFRYEPPEPTVGLTNGLKIQVNVQAQSTEDKYKRWTTTREGPLFGSHPDAKVLAVVKELDNPGSVPILDVGSGPGRNTLPFARLGHSIDALELASVFVEQLQKVADAEGLSVTVTQGDVLDPTTKIRPAHYQLAIVAEVISHFRNLDQVRLLLARMCDALRPGGVLLFSTFLAIAGYEPTPFIRELSQVAWSFIITPDELATAMEGLPLEIVSNESAHDYERAHLPPEAWPPTNWFANWSTGRDLFPTSGTPPMSLRWVLCRRV